MEDRFIFRVPFFNNQDEFMGFGYYSMLKGIEPYNSGVAHIGKINLCTGLEVKGKMLYEGDVVYVRDFGRTYIVVWNYDQASFEMKDLYNAGCGANINFGEDRVILGSIYEKQFREKIGNAYF